MVKIQKHPFELTFKEAGPEKLQTFQNLKRHSQEAFQLELLEGWIIHNVFNEDLLI